MSIKAMRRTCVLALVAFGAVALVTPLTGLARRHHHHKRPTHIRITEWDVTTLGGTKVPGGPGATLTHCATDAVHSLDVHGKVKRAIENRIFTVRFLLNGVQRDLFHESWTGTGPGHFDDGISNDSGLPDGFWQLKVVQKGKTIGQSGVTLAADPAC